MIAEEVITDQAGLVAGKVREAIDTATESVAKMAEKLVQRERMTAGPRSPCGTALTVIEPIMAMQIAYAKEAGAGTIAGLVFRAGPLPGEHGDAGEARELIAPSECGRLIKGLVGLGEADLVNGNRVLHHNASVSPRCGGANATLV